MNDLKDKVVLITGAGKGAGRALRIGLRSARRVRGRQ